MPLGVKLKCKSQMPPDALQETQEESFAQLPSPAKRSKRPLPPPAASPWLPNLFLFPLKMCSRLCSVTNSSTNVTQFVWQDVIFFFNSCCFSWSRLSRRHLATPPGTRLALLPGWIDGFLPSCSVPARPPLLGKSIFHLLFCSILISPESPENRYINTNLQGKLQSRGHRFVPLYHSIICSRRQLDTKHNGGHWAQRLFIIYKALLTHPASFKVRDPRQCRHKRPFHFLDRKPRLIAVRART